MKTPPGFRRLPPEPPAILKDEALAEWHRVLPDLQRLHLTKQVDATSLASYCICWARLVEAQRIVDDEGVVTENRLGGLIKHPAVAVVESASKELRGWASEFGFTPASEQRVARQEVDDGDSQADPFARTG